MVFVHLSLGAVKDFVSDNNIDIGTKKINVCVYLMEIKAVLFLHISSFFSYMRYIQR